MQCPECSAELTTARAFCPKCGAALPRPQEAAVGPETVGTDPEAEPVVGASDSRRATRARTARLIRIASSVVFVVFVTLATAASVLRPWEHPIAFPTFRLFRAAPAPAAVHDPVASATVEATAPVVSPARAGVEAAIRGFYATVDAGRPLNASGYVWTKGRGGIAPVAVEASGTTKFSIARAVIGTSTADVYGRESRSVIATGGLEVEFRLHLVDKEWLISAWQVARPAPIPSQTLSLTGVTARDVVGTLLQARQIGDATTMRMLTTPAFQAAHLSWFDGADRTTLLTSYSITAAAPKDGAFAVTADEQWLPDPLITTYTVIIRGGDILVDGWSWKKR